MTRINRYGHTIVGLINACGYIVLHYRSRKKLLKESILPLFPDTVVPTAISERFHQYIPPFLFIEFLFTQLWNRPLTEEESRRSMLLNGLTPLFDDMMDELRLDGVTIHRLITRQEVAEHPKSRVCQLLFQAGGFTWNQYWEAVVQAQMNSQKQIHGKIPFQELYLMTVQKGAASVELGWQVIIEGQGGKGMQNIAAGFGAFAQILNDIFDVWKDREAGIQTLVTGTTDIVPIQQLYRKSVSQVIKSIQSVDTREKSKNRVIALLSIIFCLGELALERLCQLQSDGRFNAHDFTRGELVCDMAKWRNRWRWLIKVLQWKTH